VSSFAPALQQNQPVAPAEFEAPIDPETGAPDPFAYHRHITGHDALAPLSSST
jgi:hypothetical protein